MVDVADVVNALIVSDSGPLLVEKKGRWILPGGKRKPGESDINCLEREIGEELPGVRIKSHNFYKEFVGLRTIAGSPMRSLVYFVEIEGKPNGVGKNDSVTDYAWADRLDRYDLSHSTRIIFERLRDDGYDYYD